ncbi:uncharacterized protein APUU_70544S [Aspergillus puulaauensis]|uniref:Uncharacterized protein n=1 Tax=Aspergillus puulaauensis TaxID=1220207 RepID=A0A7R8AR51_9EURO|nr:uncharacterized protein APUU_70544S [Aspergillus puulaauensis]BCS28974.1 hypothetical protein APUU_70544S [Aspergillus puulaauensis]
MCEIILPRLGVFCCRQQCFSGHNLVFEKEDTQKSAERMEVQRVFCFPLSGLADASSSLGAFLLQSGHSQKISELSVIQVDFILLWYSPTHNSNVITTMPRFVKRAFEDDPV